MDDLKIRAPTVAEIEPLRALERRAATRFADTAFPEAVGHDPASPEDLVKHIAGGGVRVADVVGMLAGFVIFRAVDGCGYIEELDVDTPFAGRRIGARLIEAVAEEARRRGWSALTLSTYRDIPWNAPWYRRLGFVDLDDTALTPGLVRIRGEHIVRGLRESERVFMRRAL